MPRMLPNDIIVWDHRDDILTIEYAHPSDPTWSYRVWFLTPEGDPTIGERGTSPGKE